MSPLSKFLVRRLAMIPITLLLITAMLYGIIMLTPPQVRAQLYLPSSVGSRFPQERIRFLTQRIIAERGLDDPFFVQYFRWLGNIVRGDWGYSPVQGEEVLVALVRRTPATAELTLYSILMLAPLGLASGVIAGWRENRLPDFGFRLVAFIATSFPPFVMALLLLTLFYVGVKWFPPGRVSVGTRLSIATATSTFQTYTGLLTIDGLLNGRPEISREALQHLVLPVITLSLAHWATLGRVTRAAIIEQLNRPYILAARGRGLSMWRTVWVHALRNALLPALNSSALSAASLVAGVFVVEIVFLFPGVSEPITRSLQTLPDTAMAMGFAIYSSLVVLPIMLVLDLLQIVVDPRMRRGGADA